MIFGEVNDAAEYKRATVLVFDQDAIAGASSSPSGVRYFEGFATGTERAEIFSPQTPTSLAQELSLVAHVLVRHERLLVFVAEGIETDEPYVI